MVSLLSGVGSGRLNVSKSVSLRVHSKHATGNSENHGANVQRPRRPCEGQRQTLLHQIECFIAFAKSFLILLVTKFAAETSSRPGTNTNSNVAIEEVEPDEHCECLKNRDHKGQLVCHQFHSVSLHWDATLRRQLAS